MNVVQVVGEVVVPIVALVVPYVVKTHGNVKKILSVLQALADAANGPEQK